MITGNVGNEPLAKVVVKNLNLKINHADKRLVFQIIYFTDILSVT